jgi:tetratricopeptide (TPR) repeat protein
MLIRQFTKLSCIAASIALTNAIFAFSAAYAHEQGEQGNPEILGNVNFATSCDPAGAAHFNRAMALLHSFWYAEAAKRFTEIAQADSGCAIAHWGVAMTFYHLLWAPPSPSDLKSGSAAVERAKNAGAKTQRERDYIGAIEVFYKDPDKLDHRTRAKAYEKAMQQVYERSPDDPEAAIFYALALISTAPATDKTFAQQFNAATILNKLAAQMPNHPGIIHYIIHSYDYPPLAQLALPAARSYAKVAPSVPHALHMPSHIFTRLGLWDEAIETDIASATTAKTHVDKTNPGTQSFDWLHSLDYMVYAYLQTAQDGRAKVLVDEVGSVAKVDDVALPAAYAMAAIPARYALERRQWKEAASLRLKPAEFPWSRFPQCEAITFFARAVGAARSGDLANAELYVERLDSLQQGLPSRDPYWAEQVEIQRRAAAAWIAYAKGEREKALKLMQSAADLESTTEKHPVTPGAVVPAREFLADMLIDLGRPDQALKEYESVLAASPNRFNGLHGAAQAAEKSGDSIKARAYYAQLTKLSNRADSDRPELKQARGFLARN